MRKLFFITLQCIILLAVSGCRHEPKSGNVSFKVFRYEIRENMAAPNAYVSVFKNGELVAKKFTDNSATVSFILPEGHYTAVAEEGEFSPQYSSDTSLGYSDTIRANGPHEFDVIAGGSSSILAIMDDIAHGKDRLAPATLEATVIRQGQPCAGAKVTLHGTLTDALAGTNKIIIQYTDSKGSTVFNWHPGHYYIVATWKDSQGINYTSDTSRTKDPPPITNANGPQQVEVKGKLLRDHVITIVDLHK
jgi:hypothetical protein